MTNWKVRIRNKTWWLLMTPAVLVLIKTIASIFGYELNLEGIGENIGAVIEALFMVLALVGIINDPTTPGVKDGTLGSQYEYPGQMPK